MVSTDYPLQSAGTGVQHVWGNLLPSVSILCPCSSWDPAWVAGESGHRLLSSVTHHFSDILLLVECARSAPSTLVFQLLLFYFQVIRSIQGVKSHCLQEKSRPLPFSNLRISLQGCQYTHLRSFLPACIPRTWTPTVQPDFNKIFWLKLPPL